MEKIAIVDDSDDQRDTYKKRLSLFLKKRESSLEVIDTFPFRDINTYFEWIINENIIALILDEKLHVESQKDSIPVDYSGSFLVLKIRERFKDIPIFTLTNYSTDEELQNNFNQFEYILSKEDFSQKHVDIILRSCQRYLVENKNELSLFDDLTKKIATGNVNSEETVILKALQQKLHIPLTTDLKNREEWLKEYENQIHILEELKTKLKDLIDKK
jgi:hypothetical protein